MPINQFILILSLNSLTNQSERTNSIQRSCFRKITISIAKFIFVTLDCCVFHQI